VPSLQAKVLFDRGLIQFHKKKPDKAAELFKEAVLEDPSYAEALYNLACCYSMLGQRDDAIVYLDRAAKLDQQCIDWAKEDPEFDPIRDDEAFQKTLHVNDLAADGASGDSDLMAMIDFGEEDTGGFESVNPDELEHIDQATAGEIPEDGSSSAPRKKRDPDELPPCAQCGALVVAMRIQRFNPFLSLGVTACGVALTIALTWLGLLHSLAIGIPTVIAGLWMFTRIDNTWVCQNCGARGAAAGQPPQDKRRTGAAGSGSGKSLESQAV